MIAGRQFATGALAITLCMAASAAARDYGAHVHGAGQLNIAADGIKLEIELIVPGADIVGFEHHPASAAEKEAITAAETELRAGDRLFFLPAGAHCRFDGAKVALEFAEQTDDNQHDHEHHDHDASSNATGQAHAHLHAQYRFLCDRIERLSHIDVRLFQHYSAIRELSAQWILASGQGATRVTPASARLDL